MIKETAYQLFSDYPIFMTEVFISISILLIYFTLKIMVSSARAHFRTQKDLLLNTFDVLFEVHIRNRFPNQSQDCMSCMRSGVRTALRHKSSRRPAVILLLHTEQSRQTAACLGTRLLRVCLAAGGQHKPPGHVQRHLTVDGRDYSGVSDFWDFYNALRERLALGKMVLVQDFQAVHSHAVTLVSTLTHEQFSPETQAIVVLLLEMSWYDASRSECASKVAETWVEQSFGHALDDPARQDLISTVTARAALVLQEPLLPKDT